MSEAWKTTDILHFYGMSEVPYKCPKPGSISESSVCRQIVSLLIYSNAMDIENMEQGDWDYKEFGRGRYSSIFER